MYAIEMDLINLYGIIYMKYSRMPRKEQNWQDAKIGNYFDMLKISIFIILIY